jgi:hypothetical protein
MDEAPIVDDAVDDAGEVCVQAVVIDDLVGDCIVCRRSARDGL